MRTIATSGITVIGFPSAVADGCAERKLGDKLKLSLAEPYPRCGRDGRDAHPVIGAQVRFRLSYRAANRHLVSSKTMLFT